MACTGRWAEAYDFVSFWCIGSVITGVDDGVGAGRATLADLTVDFINAGVVAGIGQLLYNTTTGAWGRITGVTMHTVTATLAGATVTTWANGDTYRLVLASLAELQSAQTYLDLVAGDINIAMQSAGACDCSLSAASLQWLKKINVIEAASFYTCPCGKPTITDDMKQAYLNWATDQLTALREGKIELCAGYTGADFPAYGVAQQGWTEFNDARIIANDIIKDS